MRGRRDACVPSYSAAGRLRTIMRRMLLGVRTDNWVRRRLACIPTAAHAPGNAGASPAQIATIAAKLCGGASARCADEGQARRLRTQLWCGRGARAPRDCAPIHAGEVTALPGLAYPVMVRARRPRSQDACAPRRGHPHITTAPLRRGCVGAGLERDGYVGYTFALLHKYLLAANDIDDTFTS